MTDRSESAKRALAFATRHFGVRHIEIDSNSLRRALVSALSANHVNLSARLTDDLMLELVEEVQVKLGEAAFEFGWRGQKSPRSEIGERLIEFKESLERLLDSLGIANAVLASSGRNRDHIDLKVLQFIAALTCDAEAGPKAAFERFRAVRDLIEPMFKDAEVAVDAFNELPKGGRPAMESYEHVVQAALLVADRIGLTPTITGDRSEDPYSTPFTRIVFECLEPLIPADLKAQSESLSACAKRLERSPLWRSHRGLD